MSTLPKMTVDEQCNILRKAADGQHLEYCSRCCPPPITDISGTWTPERKWLPVVGDSTCQFWNFDTTVYRVKPGHTASRPWTQQEFPYLALFRSIHRSHIWCTLLWYSHEEVMLTHSLSSISYRVLWDTFQYSLDGGETWETCGTRL